MINEERIKAKVKKAIAIRPATIELMRLEKKGNGMRGSSTEPVTVKKFDIFLDDSKHNLLLDNAKESGVVRRTRGISMLAVTEGFEIKEGDYFETNEAKYKVIYPGLIIKDVYNSDLEVIK